MRNIMQKIRIWSERLMIPNVEEDVEKLGFFSVSENKHIREQQNAAYLLHSLYHLTQDFCISVTCQINIKYASISASFIIAPNWKQSTCQLVK